MIELTYAESSLLMADGVFRERVKTACLQFARSIMSEGPGTPAQRQRWAQQCLISPDMVAAMVQPPTVMDPMVQSAGADIDDVTLQGAVEATVTGSFVGTPTTRWLSEWRAVMRLWQSLDRDEA